MAANSTYAFGLSQNAVCVIALTVLSPAIATGFCQLGFLKAGTGAAATKWCLVPHSCHTQVWCVFYFFSWIIGKINSQK